MKNKKILVLSPHLDDAVLSCCDHILDWIKEGGEVTIITIFTSFKNNFISKSAQEYINNSGFDSTEDFEKQRKKEDIEAMTRLRVKWKHLDFIDGWFRCMKNKSVYPDQDLFKGKISPLDKLLLEQIRKALTEYKNFDHIVIPFGIGNHVDHLLITKIVENIFEKRKLIYYLDNPYASNINNWTIVKLIKVLISKKSIKPISTTKKQILNNYKSQITLLFTKSINYKEYLISST